MRQTINNDKILPLYVIDIQIILLGQLAPPREALILKVELVKKLQGLMIRINLIHWAVGWQVNLNMLEG